MAGRLGDTLEGPTGSGRWVAVTVSWVLDPADESFVAEGIGVPAGCRSLVVASTFTNLGSADFLAPPDVRLVLVDADGTRHGRATATLTAYPRFRHSSVAPGESVAGHSYFVLPREAVLHRVEWVPGDGPTADPPTADPPTVEVLTWLL